MSEDFDREAEKERLREKLAAEEESRQSTEHMSELLLKGATMTNRHCDTCSDPIFRYDGQSFCPTCEKVVDEDEPSRDSGVTADEETPTAADASSGTESSASAADQTNSQQDVAAEPERERGADREAGADDEAPRAGAVEPGAGRQQEGSRASTGSRGGEMIGDLPEARASLVRTLSDLAARAESSEDVRRTRDHLAAAREAAEAIAALDRADR